MQDMSVNADAAEQVVRLTLEGTEVIAKLSGRAAEKIAIALVALMKDQEKTKGKARLTQMLRSGKPLQVYSVKQKDLKTFQEQAKRYGILYCVLRNKDSMNNPEAEVDIFARKEDDSRIARISEKFGFATTHRVDVVQEAKNSLEKAKDRDNPFIRGNESPSKNGSGQNRIHSEPSLSADGKRNDREPVKARMERIKKEYQKDIAASAGKALEAVKTKGDVRE